jgi:hypothetical protein
VVLPTAERDKAMAVWMNSVEVRGQFLGGAERRFVEALEKGLGYWQDTNLPAGSSRKPEVRHESKHSRRCASLLHAVLGTMGLVAALAGPAPAQTMQSVCRNYPCIYDQNGRGQVLGYALFGGNAIRQETSDPAVGEWFDVNYTKDGLSKNIRFYHNTSDCSDQPYFSYSGEIPQNAYYDGQSSLWSTVGEVQTFTWNAYRYYEPSTNGLKCQPYGYCWNYQTQQQVACTGTGAPAVKIETPVFYPPFNFKPLH